VAQDLLDDQRFFDQRDEAHRLAAFRTLQNKVTGSKLLTE
jgi:hypothetical protein